MQCLSLKLKSKICAYRYFDIFIEIHSFSLLYVKPNVPMSEVKKILCLLRNLLVCFYFLKLLLKMTSKDLQD